MTGGRLKHVCALEAVCAPTLPGAVADPSLERKVQDVRRELGDAFDKSELAVWLSSPNVWLQSRVPLELLVLDAASVLAAARTDRFVVEG